jgi:hypothetical protein
LETKNKKGGRGFIFENDEKPTLLDEVGKIVLLKLKGVLSRRVALAIASGACNKANSPSISLQET